MITLFVIRPKGFNVGNDAIYMGLQYYIQEAFGHLVNLISLPATSRYESQAKAGLTAKTIYEINQYGHGVIVGGGNLYENGELDVSLEALETLEVPMLLFSLSHGRIYNRNHQLVPRTNAMPARTMLALDRKAAFSLSRDHATQAHLEQVGCHKTQLGGCPTIFLEKMADRLPPMSAKDREGALISIRHPELMSIPLRKQSRVFGDIVAMIAFLKEHGQKDVRLLCHDHRDIAFAASIPGAEYVYTGDVYPYLALLRSSALNISYRLHASLPCLSFGTPTIKISYDERGCSLMETLGLGEWNINMVESNDVVEQVKDRFARLDDLKALRRRIQPLWTEFHDRGLDTVKKFAALVEEQARRMGGGSHS